jgi:RNase P/RNase MRP subunit POP5
MLQETIQLIIDGERRYVQATTLKAQPDRLVNDIIWDSYISQPGAKMLANINSRLLYIEEGVVEIHEWEITQRNKNSQFKYFIVE